MPYKFTYKQLEAVFWVVELKGFASAAGRLNTTQSAVSKRIQDLELGLGIKLFDRGGHSARLTPKGNEFYIMARDLLQQRDAALLKFNSPEDGPRKISIGVSELTALTWLPRLVNRIRLRFPRAEVCPEVDIAVDLIERLRSGDLDLVIVPEILIEKKFVNQHVGYAEHIWVCLPTMLGADQPLTPEDLAQHTLLVQQTSKSATARLLEEWARSFEVELTRAIRCNSISATIGMALSGVGLGYVPRGCVRRFLEQGMLLEVKLIASPDSIAFSAACASRPAENFVHELMNIAVDSCDFNSSL